MIFLAPVAASLLSTLGSAAAAAAPYVGAAVAGAAGQTAGNAASAKANAVPGLPEPSPAASEAIPGIDDLTVSGARATQGSPVSLRGYQVPGAPRIEGTGIYKPGGVVDDTASLLKRALGGLSSGQRSQALGTFDQRQSMPGAGGGRFSPMNPPQHGVADALIQRVQQTRGNYPVPGLGA